MRRVDRAVEQEVVKMDRESKISFDFNSSMGFQRRAELESLKQCPPMKSVFTTKKVKQNAVNILN